jgi:hypothetical protein
MMMMRLLLLCLEPITNSMEVSKLLVSPNLCFK